jgi:hypothetical protein
VVTRTYTTHWDITEQGVEKVQTYRHCEERSDEAIQKLRFNMGKRSAFWRKCRLDCFALLAMTGQESFFNDLLEPDVFTRKRSLSF